MRNLRPIIIVGVLIAAFAVALTRQGGEPNRNDSEPSNQNVNATITVAPAATSPTPTTTVRPAGTNVATTTTGTTPPPVDDRPTFTAERRSREVTATQPADRARLASVPSNLSVTFGQPVRGTPTLSMRVEGVEYGAGDTVVGDAGTTIRRGLAANAPEGIYTVNYYACFVVDPCASGSFQFSLE